MNPQESGKQARNTVNALWSSPHQVGSNLRAPRCDAIQEYYFSKPLLLADLKSLPGSMHGAEPTRLMDESLWYRLCADTVLALHAAVVCFVILGPLLIVVGNLRGWRWVNALPSRIAHAAAISLVIVQSWLGAACPLTTLEMRLRALSGSATYAGGFVEYWLQRLLYYDFPAWVFTLTYTLFGLLVLAVSRRYPPQA